MALAAMALLLFSCTAKNRVPGYLYYSLQADPSTLDPAFITDVSGGSIAAKLFNGLVRIGDNKNLHVVPDIAKSWSTSPDGLTYRFRLRHGVKFSDGREVTAADFKYSFERVLDRNTLSPNTWVLDRLAGAREFMDGKAKGVEGIKVLGPYELELKLEKPFSPFLSLLAMTAAYVVPREEAGKKQGYSFSSHPVGTGPFVVEKWTPNERLVLRARGDYFGGAPKIRGIVYRVIPEELTMVVEFELGNLDVISIPAPDYSRFRNDPKWKNYIQAADGVNTYYLGLNCSKPPFNNKRLRQALNYAIDRKKILRTFLEGRGTLANGPVPPELRDWASPAHYEYNPEKARRIIREEGFYGRSVNFYITAQEEVADMAGIIQAYLAKVGINAKLRQLEWNTYKEAINKGEPDLFWLSWWADYPDAENFLYPLFDSANLGAAGNRTRYVNPEVDRLIVSGQSAASKSERDRYYKKAEDIIVDDAPWVFFWHRKDITVHQPWVGNYRIYPVYSMDKGLDVSLEAGK